MSEKRPKTEKLPVVRGKRLRWLRWALFLSLCAIVLEWRLAAHGATLAGPTNTARLAAFDESFLMLAGVCAVAMLLAWQLKGPPLGDAPRQ